jgi:transcriptional regulator with XRE-family HTH domain
MARSKRRKPVLAEKLRHIRLAMGLSQNQMIARMGLADTLLREEVSDFERNRRIPPLEVILEYARAANVTVEALIDDGLSLPDELPSPERHEGFRQASRRKLVKDGR